MSITFLAPGWLWLLLAVPAIWFVPRRLTDVRHGVLRTTVLLLLVVGMAEPVSIGRGGQAHVAVVVDGSDRAREAAEGLASRLAGAHRVALGPRDKTHRLTSSFDDVVPVGAGNRPGYPNQALEAGARVIPDGAPGAVVLIDDGQSQLAAWGPSVQSLIARGIPVHTVRMPAVAEDEPRIVRVDVLDVPRAGRPCRLRIHAVGQSPSIRIGVSVTSTTPPLYVFGGGSVSAALALDGRVTEVLNLTPDSGGVLGLTVGFAEPDGIQLSPTFGAVELRLAVQEPIRALYLGERVVEGGNRMANLVGNGGVVLEERPIDSADPRATLDGLDLVVIDDRPADTVPQAFHEELVRAVRDRGLGLVVSGGRAAFGAGGWHKSPVAKLLPVEFMHREEKRDPSTTLCVVIDTSGSMGGGRVQLAKEVARLAIRRLLPHDKVGIVEFYGAKRWAAPIQPASNRIEIERALNRMNAGGGTVILPAIEESFYGLQNVQTRYKHVLVLTDGGVERGSFEPLLRKMADKGINVSTVLIGGQAHSEFLVSIANWGKGRFYGVPNRFNLPEIILKQPASARLPAYRPGTHTVRTRGGPRWWGGDAPTDLPPLKGYVETKARDGAETIIEVAKGRRPVLSTWRYGLGRVTAFMSEPVGPGTDPWRDWEDYGSFLARVMARTASDMRSPYKFSLRRGRGTWQLVAKRVGPTEASPVARPLGRNGEPGEALAFQRRADDLWIADAGDTTNLKCGADDGGLTPPVWVALDPNLQGTLVDPEQGIDLAALSKATGGRALTLAEASSFVPSTGGGTNPLSVTRLWPWLVLLALIAYVLDIWHRRRERPIIGSA